VRDDFVSGVRAALLDTLTACPERLYPFFSGVISALDGLESALYAIAGGHRDIVLEKMHMWHRDIASGGYREWATSYFNRAVDACHGELPGDPTASEAEYLALWRQQMRSLIEDSAREFEHVSAP
jgi:hypothetical protein